MTEHQERAPAPRDAAFEIIAFACSAGGLHALTVILSALPAALPVPLVIVQHLDPHHRSLMPEILGRSTKLRVMQAQADQPVLPSTVYMAPPDRHLLIKPDLTFMLAHTELVHFVRPSADLLFESVAAIYREHAIGVVLTGTGSDGAMGVKAIKKMGGKVIVQSQETAEFPGMPQAAIRTQCVDSILPLDRIPGALVQLVTGREPE